MKRKIVLLSLIVVFVLLIGGASLLYSRLEQSVDSDQLATTDQAGQTDAPTQNAPETDASSEDSPSGDDTPEEIPAPDFTVYDIDGKTVNLHDYLGKPIVLNFWASWCGPCKMEMPDFNEKYLELGDEVHFLMINMTGGRETLETASTLIAESGYTFPVFYDTEGDAAATYGAYSLPTTYFIDAEGIVIARAVGAIDAATLQRGIDMIHPASK